MPHNKPVDVIFCGPAQSGKTALFMQFLDNKPTESATLFTPTHFETYFLDYPITSWDVSDENYPQSNDAIWLYCVDLSQELDESTLIEAIHEIKKRNPFKVCLVGTKNDTPGANRHLRMLVEVCTKYKLNFVSTSTTEEKGHQALIDTIGLSIHQLSTFSSEGLDGFRTNLEQVPVPLQRTFIPSVQAGQEPAANGDGQSEVQARSNDETQPAQPQSPVVSSESQNTGATRLPEATANPPSFDEAAASLKNSLKPFPAKSKKIMKEVAELKKVILHAEKEPAEKKRALTAFHNKSLAILEHKHHPALKALLAFTTFVFCAVVVAAIGFSIIGLVTGIWAPALFIAALTAAQPAAIAVVSSAGAAALIAGACTTYGLFKAPKPIDVQKEALGQFVSTERAKLDSESPSA